ncbi:heavy-metal-associated domain-containing protein [Mangrovicoccus sp. HB161399]|uniref:heavy-metal-associated domain-containing protein n=1 Tax=Mangrovicoccus sp. HB161399 TaxID=2720392 RepID=UPI001557F27D|nr:heavy-metal-associated domain-containing protein [Mangrovicoccus sp. HB161399]
MKFSVPDMSCGHCRASIEKAVKGADPAASLAFDQDSRQVEIGSGLDAPALTAVLAEAGYSATVLAA